jgi:hypothetical protein
MTGTLLGDQYNFLSYLAEFLEWEMFQTKAVEKIKTWVFHSITFLRKSCHLWDNVEKCDRGGLATSDSIIRVRRMRFACRINKAAETHSKRVILTDFSRLRELVSVLRCRLRLKRDGTRWRTGGEVKGKLLNGVGSQSPSHRFTVPRNMVYRTLLPLMRATRLPIVDWTDASTDLNGLVRFVERRNLVSARVPSHFKRSLRTLPVLSHSSKVYTEVQVDELRSTALFPCIHHW